MARKIRLIRLISLSVEQTFPPNLKWFKTYNWHVKSLWSVKKEGLSWRLEVRWRTNVMHVMVKKKHYKNNQQSNRENSFIIWQRTRMTSQELFDISKEQLLYLENAFSCSFGTFICAININLNKMHLAKSLYRI